MNKESVRQLIVAQLDAACQNQARAAALARDEATHEESRPESKYDTHSQEAAYLAEGQARLAAELAAARGAVAALPLPRFTAADPVALGALVELEQPHGTAWYFIGPAAGGTSVQIDGHEILVVTPASPLGRQLMGAAVGAAIQLPRGRGRILNVC
ncbi:MAG: transcription elongation factor [Opitutaceae bacterium]|nr:transcription elongation factor [Opitutaceae bacterium]